jgi:hypothetical protein
MALNLTASPPPAADGTDRAAPAGGRRRRDWPRILGAPEDPDDDQAADTATIGEEREEETDMTRWPLSVLFGLLLLALNTPATVRAGHTSPSPDHSAWVAHVLTRMETIKPGMTRQDLLDVFTTEGGLSDGLRRTFVSRDCPYFKVDVQFAAVGRPARDPDGRVTLAEDLRDVITQVSRPYIQRTIMD